jgi:integrase/recombinase XerD
METESNPLKTFPNLYRTATVAPTKKQILDNAFKIADSVKKPRPLFSELLPEYRRFEKYDDKAESTIDKYEECLSWIQRYLPHISSPVDLKLDDLIILKDKMKNKKLSISRVNHIMTALRMFLKFCTEIAGLPVMGFESIKVTKIPPHEVKSLKQEELKQLLDAMEPHTKAGLRMRAMAEFFISTGSRPTAGLSVDHANIIWDENGIGEVTVTGKGQKANILFITKRAGEWIKRYIESRTDSNPALFVTFGKSNRMTNNDLHKLFKHYSKKAGFEFTINPQMLRRTIATIAQENGADIYAVKDFLNQSRVETTIKHYVSRNPKVLKESHNKYVKLSM